MANPCPEYFGTHPCLLPRGHAGPHGRPERTYTEAELKLERAAVLRQAADLCRRRLIDNLPVRPRPLLNALGKEIEALIPQAAAHALDQFEEAAVLKGQHMIRDLIRTQIPYFEDNKVTMSIARYVTDKVAEAVERDRAAYDAHALDKLLAEARLEEAESFWQAMTHFENPSELEIWVQQRLAALRAAAKENKDA